MHVLQRARLTVKSLTFAVFAETMPASCKSRPLQRRVQFSSPKVNEMVLDAVRRNKDPTGMIISITS